MDGLVGRLRVVEDDSCGIRALVGSAEGSGARRLHGTGAISGRFPRKACSNAVSSRLVIHQLDDCVESC